MNRTTAFALTLLFTSGAFLIIVPAGADIIDNGDGTFDFTEDFQDENAFDLPTEDWYTFSAPGSGSIYVDTNGDLYNSGGFLPTFAFNGVDVCQADEFNFFFDPANGLNSRYRRWDLVGTGGSVRFEWWIENGQWDLRVSVTASGTTTGPNLVGNDATGAIKAGLTSINCADARFVFHDYTHNTYSVVDAGGSIGSLTSLVYSRNEAISWIMDDINILGAVQGTPSPPADATQSATSIVGFDVDLTGSTAIARTDGGDVIRAYQAQSLNPYATTVSSNCNRVDGVAALPDYVSWFNCDSGDPTDVTSLQIGAANLGAPDFGPACSDEIGVYCTAVLPDSESTNDAGNNLDKLIDLATIETVPFDYTYDGAEDNEFTVVAAWAISDTDGNIGVAVYTWRNNLDDYFAVGLKALGTQTPDSVCTRPLDENSFFLYGASSVGDAKGWRVDLVDTNPGGFKPIIEPQFTLVFPGGVTPGARALGCGGDHFAIGEYTSISLWDCDTCSSASPYNTLSVNQLENNGIDMSDDGKWLAYVDADGGHVACIDNINGCFNGATNETVTVGEIVTDFAIPSGTFVRVQLHGAASSVWVATSTTINRYDISPYTTGSPVAYNPDLEEVPGGGGGAGGQTGDPEDNPLLGEALQTASDSTGFSIDSLAVLLAAFQVLMTATMVAAIAFSASGGNIIATAVGGVAGLVLGIVVAVAITNLLNTFWLTFVIMIAVALAITAAALLLGSRR